MFELNNNSAGEIWFCCGGEASSGKLSLLQILVLGVVAQA